MSFQPLPTTPAVQAMNDTLLRNLWSYREMDGGVDGGADEGEETESAYEEDEDVEMEMEIEEEVQEEVNPSPPPPEVEMEVEVAVAAKEKKSPKLHIPVRIWNQVVPRGKADAQVVQKVQEVQNPKVDSPKCKRISLVLNPEVEPSDASAQEQEAEAGVEERGRRKRTKTLKASQNEEISRAKTSGASRSRGHAASASTSRPASRTAATTAPRSRGSQNAPLSSSALALETAGRTLALRDAVSSSSSSSTLPTLPLTPPTPPPNEGPRAAWHRLFPHLPPLSDYYHIGEWRELMVWKEAEGWIVRAADDPWEKPVFRKPGWNSRDEEQERLWEGCVRRMVRERGWTYEGRVAGDVDMVRAAERAFY